LNLDSFYLSCDDNKNNCILLKNDTVIYNIVKSQNNDLMILQDKSVYYRADT